MICSTCSGQMNPEMNSDARFCTCCGRPLQPAAAYTAYAQDRLVRPLQGRMIGGVCAAIALREGWDPALVRLAAVLLFFGGFGLIFVAYIAGWIIIPKESAWTAPIAGPGPTMGVAAS